MYKRQPSKLLIAAAEAAHAVGRAPGFGVSAGPIKVDGRAVMARVRAERDRFVGFVTETVDAWPAERIIRQRARFIAPMTLGLDDGRQIRAGRIVIATGSRPRIPAGWRALLGDRLLTNDDVFEWRDLPSSVAVVGGGVIGLELGQALSRLGVRVRLFQRSQRLGGLTDPAIAQAAASVLSAEFPISLDTVIDAVSATEYGVRVRYHNASGEQQEDFEYLLCAIGRVPNLDGLDLERAGLPAGPDGVPVTDADTCSAELTERQQAANELALAGIEKSRTIRELKKVRAELEARALDKFIRKDRLFVVHDNVFFNQHNQVICSGRGQTIRPA